MLQKDTTILMNQYEENKKLWVFFFSLTAVGAWKYESRNELSKNWGSFLSMATIVLFSVQEKLSVFTPPSPVDTFKCSWTFPRFYLTNIFMCATSFWFWEIHRKNSLTHLSESYEMKYCLPFRIVAPGLTFAVKYKWWKSGSAQVCGWIWQK